MFLGETALDFAVQKGHTETAEVLRNNGEPNLYFFLKALKSNYRSAIPNIPANYKSHDKDLKFPLKICEI